MKSTRQVFIYLLSIIFIISLLSACNKKNNPIIQNNNWQTIYQNSNLDFISVKFLNADTGYVIATDLTSFKEIILSTKNGGDSWTIDTCLFPTKDDLNRDIFPLDKWILLGVGFYVYKSNNMGKTWANVSPQFVGSRIDDLHIIDSTTWVVAQGVEIFRTINAGQTWQNVFHTDSVISFNQFSFPFKEIGYASIGRFYIDVPGSIGLILKTTDGGQNWIILNPEPWKLKGIEMPYIYAIQFITDQIGYISTFDNELYKTIDGGYNWTLVHNNKKISLEYFISENFGYCTDGTTIDVTKNGGITWEVDYSIVTDYVTGGIIAWTVLETGQGYALTRDHRIIKKMN